MRNNACIHLLKKCVESNGCHRWVHHWHLANAGWIIEVWGFSKGMRRGESYNTQVEWKDVFCMPKHCAYGLFRSWAHTLDNGILLFFSRLHSYRQTCNADTRDMIKEKAPIWCQKQTVQSTWAKNRFHSISKFTQFTDTVEGWPSFCYTLVVEGLVVCLVSEPTEAQGVQRKPYTDIEDLTNVHTMHDLWACTNVIFNQKSEACNAVCWGEDRHLLCSDSAWAVYKGHKFFVFFNCISDNSVQRPVKTI